MMPSEHLVVWPSEILCNIGYFLSKMIKEVFKMSKEKNTDSLLRVSRVLSGYLKEVRTKVCKVLVYAALAEREFFFLLFC